MIIQRALITTIVCTAFATAMPPASAAEAAWKAGVATRIITPSEPMWMAGYAARKGPSEGKEHDLKVKALAMQDPSGVKAVVVTADLVGVSRTMTDDIARVVKKKTGLPRERLMITVSHTHCGPVLAGTLIDMYAMPETQAAKIAPYTRRVTGLFVEAIVEAMGKLESATLDIGMGKARFAVNRRKATPKGISLDANPTGPVDHDVPVLRVRSAKGKTLAVVFGYACHNTTLQDYRWCGDYAGFAMLAVEAKYPGAVAMFWTGCGADANPYPRGKIEMCRKYGKELAAAVNDTLSSKLTAIKGHLAAVYHQIELPFGELPSAGVLAAELLSKTHAVHKRAERLKKLLDAGQKIDNYYRHYPVQVWRLGDQVTWVALGGEVVVDYARRLKKELPRDRTLWITAYANDVMAYIPSRRVLAEGGYEADLSQIYYGQPAKWSPAIEDRIIAAVKSAVKEVSGK